MIDIKQFAGKIITPKDDALLYDFWLNEKSGIFEGCEVTHLGANQLQIASGRGIIKGRIFVVTQETINATVSDSGTKLGRLIIRVDVSNVETPISFVTQIGATLPDLVQEDINRDGTVFELPIVTYTATELLIDNLTPVAPVVTNAPAAHTHSASDITSTLPISKGGTGSTTAAGARTALGVTPANIGAATTTTYTATISTSWSGSGPYTQNVTVTGLLSTDNPIVGPVLSATLETRQAQQEAWDMVSRITTSNNTLSLTCDEDKPTTAIPIQIMVVR
jgi:hypothetical protein